MSWKIIEKSTIHNYQYMLIKYSNSISNGSTNSFNATGYNNATISFTSTDDTGVDIENSINNEDFFTIKKLKKSNNHISISIPMIFIRVKNSQNSVNNINILLRS